MKKIITCICLLALLTTFIGCSKGSDKKQEVNTTSEKNSSITSKPVDVNSKISAPVPIAGIGSYVECDMKQLEIQQGERDFGYRLNSKDQYEILTYVKHADGICDQVYCSTYDGKRFEKTAVEWASNACKDLKVIPYKLGISEDGNDYIIAVKKTPTDGINIESFMLIRNEGINGYLDITPSIFKDGSNSMANFSGTFFDQVSVTKDQILCYRDTDDLQLNFYDLKKNKMIECNIQRKISHAILKDNKLYYTGFQENELGIYDMDQATTKTVALPYSTTDVLYQIIQVGPENEILFLDRSGIQKFKEEDGTWEILVDGSQTTLSLQSYCASSLIAMPGSSTTYFVMYDSWTGGANLAAKYEQNKDGTIIYEKELTICGLYDSYSVREAILYYRKKHPEVKIEYKVLADTVTEIPKSDILQALNTELLAGKGADIIIMDDLPLSAYIEKGVFMDISDIFTKSGENSILLKNISDCYTNDGKIYCMPMRVFLPYYGMDKDIMDHTKSVEDMATYCEGKDMKLMQPFRYDTLVRFFLTSYSSEIFSEDGLINQGGLSSFLRNIDIIAKQIGSDAVNYGMIPSGYEIDRRLTKYYFGTPDMLMWEKHPMLITDTVGSNADCEKLIGIMNHINGTYGTINDSFYPNGLVGINQQTNEPETAKDFVSCLFAEDIQSKDIYDGFPVNENALNSWAKQGRSCDHIIFSNQVYNIEEIPFQGLTETNMQNIVTMVKSLTRPAYTDENGCAIIIGIATEYLKGDRTLEQAVNEISQKIDLYQSE